MADYGSSATVLLLCLTITATVAGIHAATKNQQDKIDDIKPVSFIFGDSLSDTGNNKNLARSLARADYPWYGIDYNNGVPTGRFSNGRTIADIVSEKMGMPIPVAYLASSTNVDAIIKNGVNYASGGGGILNETGWLFIQRLSLSRQIEMFEGTKYMVAEKIGKDAAEKFVNSSVYLMSIGSNDFINNYLFPVAPDAWKYSPEDFIEYLMSSLDHQLTKLHSLGVRKVVFIGLGPLGCIPLQRVTTSDGNCRTSLNNWALMFNAAANRLVKKLNSKLPAANFNFADGYYFFMDILQNPKNYGFQVADKPCCSLGRYRPTLSCVPAARLCSDRSKYVFWDEYHPSDATNVILANTLMAAMGVNQSSPAAPAPAHPAPAAPAPAHPPAQSPLSDAPAPASAPSSS